ncbi:carbohydrate ABC transporter permease [Microbacterium sp. Au-Mic1]|uniref:carbohydrate ABC transporter permease n=1 Tax=Microbacterium sp. Au-Mic1 TaxID=2906457 RepID=UPI001E603C74|nr:carbohydrate ABC transporter permease [Microbacterium sp. Au-Mic1]MCE4026248.1 carbohydrate ABC transporter permease [Microbacterium sp. Au-Mic1]
MITRHRTSTRVVLHTLGIVLAAMYVVPLAYILLTAVTPTGEPIGRLPSRLAFDNFATALGSAQFGTFAVNSLIVSIAATLVQVVLACGAGYALAKLPLPGGKTILLLLVALIVVPPEIVLVPLFLMMVHFPLLGGNDIVGAGGTGLLDMLGGLMVPHLISALAIFLMRQFYLGLPDELGDAARVDGAGELRIFIRIYTPLVLPAVTVVAVFAFQGAWNDFIWPLVMIRSPERETLPLGLTGFFQENSTQWNLLMAVVLLISVPVVALFLYIQRYFRSDVLSGAVK